MSGTAEHVGMTVGEAFDVLGMPPTDDLHAINVRYRSLAKRHHPDGAPKDQVSQRAANERMARLNAANDVLTVAAGTGSLVALAGVPEGSRPAPGKDADPWAGAPWADEVPEPPQAERPQTAGGDRSWPAPPPPPRQQPRKRVPRPRTVAAYWRCRRSYTRWLGVTAGLAAASLVAYWAPWAALDRVLAPEVDVASGRTLVENYAFDLAVGLLFTVNALRLVKRLVLAFRAWRAGLRPARTGGGRVALIEVTSLALLSAGLVAHEGNGAGDPGAPVGLGHALMATAAATVLVASTIGLRRTRRGGVFGR